MLIVVIDLAIVFRDRLYVTKVVGITTFTVLRIRRRERARTPETLPRARAAPCPVKVVCSLKRSPRTGAVCRPVIVIVRTSQCAREVMSWNRRVHSCSTESVPGGLVAG